MPCIVSMVVQWCGGFVGWLEGEGEGNEEAVEGFLGEMEGCGRLGLVLEVSAAMLSNYARYFKIIKKGSIFSRL